MAYYPGHQYFVRTHPATAVIDPLTGLVTGATAISAAGVEDIGYTSPSGVSAEEGTRIGYAAGRRAGSYGALGARVHTLGVDLRIGSGEFVVENCAPNGDAVPPELDLYFGVSGQWANALYRARCNTVTLSAAEEGNREITASAQFIARARQSVSPITLGYGFEQFGAALLWTDVRIFTIAGANHRDKLMGFDVTLNQNLEAKGLLPEFGANVPGSRVPYEMLPHHKDVSGTLTLHDLPSLEAGLFEGSANALQWSNIVLNASTVDGAKSFVITINNPRPTGRMQNAIESAAQMSWTVPFVADDLTVTATD